MPSESASPVAQLPDHPNLQAGRLIKLVYSSLVRSIDARMQPLELTAMQWEPLLLLAVGRADTVAGLARECNVDCGAMTRMLDRLEQKQLLQRQRSDSDRRVVNLALTGKGQDAATVIPQFVSEELQHHLSDFSPAELQAFTGFLERMLVNVAELPRVQERSA
ncbi:MAG: MarR family transcriptional regulator [Steroidobacteraceae bacterium]